MSSRHKLLKQEHGVDWTISVVGIEAGNPGQGIWTVIGHAHGWDRVINPLGQILVGDEIDTRCHTAEAGVINFLLEIA
jgi:hypothetical protein